MVAHVGAVPLEEVLPLVGGAGGALLLARAWLAARLHLAPGAGPAGKRPPAGGVDP